MNSSIGVLGCGLIGGSIGMALRHEGTHVIGFDRPEVLQRALDRGAIDEAAASIDTLTQRAIPLVLALPLQALLDTLAQHRSALVRCPWILDVAGVKQRVLERAAQAQIHNLVGGHPMAGSQRSSIEAARVDLFIDRPFVLCSDSPCPADRAEALVRAIGARPIIMTAAQHDVEVARVSHLPHLLAQAAMACEPSKRAVPSLAAGSWRDLTRVAQSDPSQWAALFEANAPALGHALDELIDTLKEARRRLADPQRAHEPIDDPQALAQARTAVDPNLPQ